jgi:hypothetical protein
VRSAKSSIIDISELTADVRFQRFTDDDADLAMALELRNILKAGSEVVGNAAAYDCCAIRCHVVVLRWPGWRGEEPAAMIPAFQLPNA